MASLGISADMVLPFSALSLLTAASVFLHLTYAIKELPPILSSSKNPFVSIFHLRAAEKRGKSFY